MAKSASFDVSSPVDLQEVDNAVNQARKEATQRYDLKDAGVSLGLDRAADRIVLQARDDYKLAAVLDILRGRLVKRGLPLKNLRVEDPEPAAGGTSRQEVGIQRGIPADAAREISRAVKSGGFKKVQVQIQEDQLRVTSPSIDQLQEVISFLKEQDFGVELTFGNFRS